MGIVVRLPVQRHARTSSERGSRTIFAKPSSVISSRPRSEAKLAKDSQCDDGMPRVRQTLTVDGATARAKDRALVPPSASMTESGVIMESGLVCTVQTCQEFAGRQTTFGTGYGAIEGMIDPANVIAGRLEALRAELEIKTQEQFAVEIGLDKSTYSLIKNGQRNLSFETACYMKDKWGLSLDWIFYGESRSSADRIMTKIGRGPEIAIPEPARKRKKS